MSAIPQSVEEAAASLQKFIDHPKTLEVLRRDTPRTLTEFRGSRPRGYISKRLAKDYDSSWQLKIIGKVWVQMFFVAPMSDGKHVLTIFAECEIEDVSPRFGLWDLNEKTLRVISTASISDNLEKLQYIYELLVQKAVGGYETPEVPVYI